MTTYRINCTDADDNIVATHEFTCRDDLAVLDRANFLCRSYGIEVWDDDRRVVWMRKGGTPRTEPSLVRPDQSAILAAIAPPNPNSVREELARSGQRDAASADE